MKLLTSRSLKAIPIAASAALVLTACGSDGAGPSQVAQEPVPAAADSSTAAAGTGGADEAAPPRPRLT